MKKLSARLNERKGMSDKTACNRGHEVAEAEFNLPKGIVNLFTGEYLTLFAEQKLQPRLVSQGICSVSQAAGMRSPGL